MYSLLCNVENLIVTPPVPRLSIGMHQGAFLAPLGRREGLLNLFHLKGKYLKKLRLCDEVLTFTPGHVKRVLVRFS
jgi:hypothetical protein